MSLRTKSPKWLRELSVGFHRNIFGDSFGSFVAVNLPPEQVVDLMKQMQTIIKEYPTEARNILIQNPQLTYAMLQSLVIMGLLPPNEAANMLHKRPDLHSLNLMNNSSQAPPPPPNLVGSLLPNPSFQPVPSLVPQPPIPIVPPPFHPQLGSMNFPMPTLPLQPSNSAMTGNSSLSRTDQEKAQLLMQVLQLSEAQIAQLPADQRASIILLREQMQQSGMISLWTMSSPFSVHTLIHFVNI